MDWIRYANEGATRNLPLSPQLVQSLAFLGDMGIQAEVFSGGQPTAGSGPRVGSVRHDEGNAADVFFYQNGRRLDWNNPDDLPVFQEIVRRGRDSGLTGFGAGDGYMLPGSMHIGFGEPAVWGAEGRGANAPEWLRAAYSGAAQGSAPGIAENDNTRVSTMNQPTQSQPSDRPRGLRGLLSNPDFLDQLSIGFGGMTLNPNTALMQMAADRISGRREERQTTQSRNRTVEWLRSQPGGERFVQLVDAIGPVGALQAYQSERSGTNLPSEIQSLTIQAQLAGLQPGTPEFQEFMLAGGGDPATFRALDRQARAAGFEPGTPEYQEFMATRGAGLSEAAVLGARTDLGGAAAGAVAAGEEQIKRAFEAYDQASQAGRSISTMNEAIAAIDNGARSGLIENFLPNVTEASAALNNAMNRMGLDVISAVTFGALSEAEMKLAMETAAPRNLEPAALRQWLVEKRDAQAKAQEALLNAARYLSDPRNNIRGWMDMQNQRESPSAPPATPPAAPSGQRFRFNSEINDFEAAQ